MKLAITAFFMAWGSFWMVPCPLKWWDERARSGMLLFLPVIGLMIGLVWALCVWLREKFLPGPVGAALLTVVPFIMSGFFHLDGYMDCADAVLSRRDLDTRRKILKDSHVGSFAVVALATLFLVEYSVFAGEPFGEKLWLLPLVCAAPRSWAVVAVTHFKPIPGSSYEKMFSDGVPGWVKVTAVCTLAALVILPVVFFGKSGLCAAAGFLGAALTIAYNRHDLQGMSGDVSGSGITVGELCALAALSLL